MNPHIRQYLVRQSNKLRPAARIAHSIIYAKYCWSHTVEDYNPVMPRPRWQTGTPPHSLLIRILSENRRDYETFLDVMYANRRLLHSIGHQPNGDKPYWDNGWFDALDAASLIIYLATKKPKRYIEIGSGHSTRFARYTIDALRLDTKLTSVDPGPALEVDCLCTQTIRSRLEECDLAVFDELEPGDILFYDGSHRAFSNSDVVVFFFEVMPRLKAGIIVHIHDIFIPNDYPGLWNRRLYNEQYLLAAMLLCKPPFRVLAPIAYICSDEDLGRRVRNIFASPDGKDIPFNYPAEGPGASFWIEMEAQRMTSV
jgi:hypothetical protein